MHGNYTDAFIDKNYNNIVNGVLVSQWELVEEYSGDFLIPIYENNEWVEGATPEQKYKDKVNKEYIIYLQRQNEGLNLYLKHEAEYRIMYLNDVITKEEFNTIEDALKPVRLELGFGQLKTAKEILKDIPASRIGVEIYNTFNSDLDKLINELYVN